MARIRSVHPGFFTDEQLVSCSPMARLLVIGLWTEADDHGVFEWKPVSLKMRLFPVDAVDLAALLAELASQDVIRPFQADGGRPYGAIRNFRKYQRPKSPRVAYPLPTELHSYVGATPPMSELTDADGPLFPQNGERAVQMEGSEGGEDGKERGRALRLPPRSASPQDLLDAWNELTSEPIPRGSKLTPTRQKLASARLRELPLDTWRGIIARIESSAFCRGQSDRGWTATFDWLLQPDTATKVSEGKYDNPSGDRAARGGSPPRGPAVPDADRTADYIAAERARREAMTR